MKIPFFWVRQKAGARAFTLVELLVVVSVIGLLAGLISAVIPRAMSGARKAKAKSETLAIISAIKAYENEYSRYPNPTTDISGEDLWIDGEDSRNLMKILSGQDVNSQNPKRVRFLEGPDERGNFQDPWKKGSNKGQYTVKLDMNLDGVVEFYGNINFPILVMSTGEDSALVNPNNSKSKNIYSWK